jgi:hypothetical protein
MPARVIHNSDGGVAREDAGKKMFDVLRSAIN